MQIGARRGEPPPVVDVPIEGREPLLAVAVDVVGELVAGLLHRFEEGAEQRARGRAAFQHQRPGVAAELVVGVGGQARSPCA